MNERNNHLGTEQSHGGRRWSIPNSLFFLLRMMCQAKMFACHLYLALRQIQSPALCLPNHVATHVLATRYLPSSGHACVVSFGVSLLLLLLLLLSPETKR